jgi:hypothetical protein
VLKAAALDPTLGSSWRASYTTGGKPGTLDILSIEDWRAQNFSAADLADPNKEATVWGNLVDYDHDGYNNVLEYAQGSSPTRSSSYPELNVSLFSADTGTRYLRATYRIREGTIGVIITPQVSSDLATWTTGTSIITGPISQGDGTALITVQDDTPLSSAGQKRFLRLQLQY